MPSYRPGFRSNPRWEAFVAREPYFSVLTAEKFLRANLTPEHEREFFASGEQLVDWILRSIEEKLQPEFAPMSALEYGCGVGRLAIPLATRAGTVTAVDASPTMLEHARREARRRHVDHIEFLTPAELFEKPRKFDLLTCCLVLQRMPTRDGLRLVRSLLGLLGPGGIGIFQVPYRATSDWLRKALRSLRGGVPGVNTLANVLQRKPLGEPFSRTYIYTLDDVIRIVDGLSTATTEMHVVLEHLEGLDTAVIFLKMPVADSSRTRVGPGSMIREEPPPIDVKDLIGRTSIDELNRAAEEYFASLTEWNHQLAKPMTSPEETPALLVDVAQLIQGLQLTPGMTVLEFGAGTGWLARVLTQLGCRSILLDVSPTALRMAQELYTRLPVIGDRPAPQYLAFDGRRIDLPDASVDRVIVFHALHHVPNADAVLAELARVLRPGGIVGCAEPGPRHSKTPMSQFEMRTYAVVENDVDVHRIWRSAEACGFSEMRLALFHAPPFHVSLAEYEDFLAGGATGVRWVDATRGFLRHVRTFFLHKPGAAALDSRSTSGLSAKIHAVLSSPSALDGQSFTIDATVSNAGAASWLPSDAPRGGVLLGAHIYEPSGTLLAFDACRQRLAGPERPIAPGESVNVRISMPPLPAGEYLIELDCVADRVTWFAQVGSPRAMLTLRVD